MLNKYSMPLKPLNKIAFTIVLTLFTISLGKQPNPRLMTFTATDNSPDSQEITIAFTIPKKDFIYKDFITCSVDNPDVTLSAWKANKQSVAHYDSSFKEAKQVFNEDFMITTTASKQKELTSPVHLYCTHYRKSDKKISHNLFPLTFTATPHITQEHIDTDITIIEYDRPSIRPKKINLLDYYIVAANNLIQIIVTSIQTDHTKYFAILIFLIIVLMAFCYFFKQELTVQIKIKELLDVITSLLIAAAGIYLLLCIHTANSPHVTINLASISSFYAGFFYIKKSTHLQSKRLRTFCTFIGILCISNALFFAFKTVQYIDQQFNLL